MGNTFSCLNVHFVFSTKERVPILNPEVRERLWPYLGGIAKQNGIHPKCIGGVADHVNLLLSMPTTLAIAKAIHLIKSGSSAWIHQTFRELRSFGWQQGYGAFSLSVSSQQINRPFGTGPLLSYFQALRARLLSFGPSGTGYTLSL
jgi:putative transposase